MYCCYFFRKYKMIFSFLELNREDDKEDEDKKDGEEEKEV